MFTSSRSRYSRMDQVKFVEDSLDFGLIWSAQRLSSTNFTWSNLEHLDPPKCMLKINWVASIRWGPWLPIVQTHILLKTYSQLDNLTMLTLRGICYSKINRKKERKKKEKKVKQRTRKQISLKLLLHKVYARQT